MFRILMVDDCETTTHMMSRRLERRGFEVFAANSGEAGIALAEEHQPDVILMDMSMPALCGFETTRRLKSSATTSKIPILALTSLARRTDVEAAIAVGCDDYETKPCDFERLIGKLTKLTRKHG